MMNFYAIQNSPDYEPDEYEKWLYWGVDPEDRNKIEEYENIAKRRNNNE